MFRYAVQRSESTLQAGHTTTAISLMHSRLLVTIVRQRRVSELAVVKTVGRVVCGRSMNIIMMAHRARNESPVSCGSQERQPQARPHGRLEGRVAAP